MGRERWGGARGVGRGRREGGKEGKGEGGKSVPANKNLRLRPWLREKTSVLAAVVHRPWLHP